MRLNFSLRNVLIVVGAVLVATAAAVLGVSVVEAGAFWEAMSERLLP